MKQKAVIDFYLKDIHKITLRKENAMKVSRLNKFPIPLYINYFHVSSIAFSLMLVAITSASCLLFPAYHSLLLILMPWKNKLQY